MIQSGGNLLLQGGEIPVAARACDVLGYPLVDALPLGKAERDDVAIVGPDDFYVVFTALHKIAEQSIVRPPRGVRRRDVLSAQYMLEHFLWQSSEPKTSM